MYGCGGVDGQMEVVAQTAYTLDVVGMVVGDQHIVNLREGESVVAELFLQRPYSHAGIYEKTFVFGVQKVAISATAASKRYESEH
jgi:hypothetical protein